MMPEDALLDRMAQLAAEAKSKDQRKDCEKCTRSFRCPLAQPLRFTCSACLPGPMIRR